MLRDGTIIQPHVLYYTCLEMKERDLDLQRLPSWRSVIKPVLELKNPHVTFTQGHNLIEKALFLTNDQNLGLDVGARQNFCATGLAASALLASKTVRDALELGLKFHRLMGSMLEIDLLPTTDGGAIVRARTRNPKSRITRFLAQEHFATILQIMRYLSGNNKPFTQVHFTFGQSERDRHNAFFGAPTLFAQPDNCIIISESTLNTCLETADPFVIASIVPVLDEMLGQEAAGVSLLEHVELIILESLPIVPTVQEISDRIGVSERNLRRKLKDADSSYREVLERVREARAVEMLMETDLPFETIAHRIGFEEARSLRRRIKKWTGHSATSLRANRRWNSSVG